MVLEFYLILIQGKCKWLRLCTYSPAVKHCDVVRTTSRVIKVAPHKWPIPKLYESSILLRMEARYVMDSGLATVP